jgi:cardiolipin synthase
MTLPNLITSLRIILAPIFIIYLIRGDFPAALVVFIIAGVSDGADGLIARLFNQKTRLGSYLDPLADKILLVAAFVVLSVRHFVPPWLTVMAISRDVLILLGVLILFLNRMNIAIRPSLLSKTTTCLQLGTIFVVLSRDYLPQIYRFNTQLFWVTGFFTVTSGLHYMYCWFKMMGEPASDDS